MRPFSKLRFTPEGFYLNGKHLKLRGLNRHQTYPFVGQAMPARGHDSLASYPRTPWLLLLAEEMGWFEETDKEVLEMLALDLKDRDYDYFILGRQDSLAPSLYFANTFCLTHAFA